MRIFLSIRRLTILLLAGLSLYAPHAWAQETFEITGSVKDEVQNGIPYANVALYTVADSVLVTGAVSNEDGSFGLRATPGEYVLRISFLSYEEKVIPVSLHQPLHVGVITLQPGKELLDEVIIQGERSTMELYLDKRIFNVGKDLTNISGSAADILNNVPSVTVDVEGNVSLRGSQNVRILIDGKPSGLTGISTADALRQVQANLIESVEVITNPSARYDAEGEVGIINIILKKDRRQGVNGAFTINAGYPDNYGGSFNLNLRRNHFNFFGSYGFSYREGPGKGTAYQSFTEPDTTFSYEQDNSRVRGGTSHNLIGGIDYFFSEKSILTGSVIYRRSDGLNTSQFVFRDYDESGTLIRTVDRREREEEPEDNGELALSYRKEFASKEYYLTADLKWIENVETEISEFTETDDSDGSVVNQRARNTENERNAFFQTDYVAPFRKKGKFETGVRTTLRVIDNDFLVEEYNNDDEWEALPDFDNNLLYTENIYAAYAMVGNETGRFSYQTGLRGELSDISVEMKRTDSANYQHYFNVFPSAHFSYKLAGENTIQLSYSYRLSRPGFRDLMPFSNYSNNRSLTTGNPNLRPEYTHSFEGGYLFNWEEGSILSSAYYRKRTGVIQRITVVDSIGYNRVFPINMATENAYGLEFNFYWTPVRWFRFNTNANFYRAITEGEYEDQELSRDTYTWTGRTIARATVLKKWELQANFDYRAPQNTPQGRQLSTYALDLALARDLMKSKATLTFSVRDVFNTRRFRNEVISEGFYSKSDFQWRARQFLVTFSYRLNQNKETKKRGDDEGSEEGGFDGGQ